MDLVRHKPATPSPSLMATGLVTGKYQYQDGELYKRCSRCCDYWPADSEFFFANKNGDGIDNTCRACYMERRYPNGRGQKKCKQ